MYCVGDVLNGVMCIRNVEEERYVGDVVVDI